ncbi:FAD-binding oxidoreductase [Nitratireductor basaltis]|uniref:FAD linked oxidase domain protein n=1 Tax=Nitratireductor basaltis TaxID=472175 RepID=A0A084U9Y8_9HYPH|nr:FAD-binding oxidoreductase [Nitratireductor basaltis]KFB09774.1 FAD linked oxidase domain protein [Nitratireductor basaltis]
MAREFASFGRTVTPTRKGLHPREARAMLEQGRVSASGMLAYGNGRSYGDSCQNSSNSVVLMQEATAQISFNPESGWLTASSSAMLSQIIAHAAPYGWFPAVVPGTQHVTLGGAIANDVHGKNHHRRGTFGCHVERFSLLRSDGVVRECSRDENTELFEATIGGMGLTGLILDATIRLMPVGHADVEESAIPFDNLEEYFALAVDADARNEYAVAWIDQLAGGQSVGRGVLLAANHAADGGAFKAAKKPSLSVPLQPPFNVLNQYSISLFNKAYRLSKLRKTGLRRSTYNSYFFPLDGVRNWNRLYGPRGLYQHQSVVPEAAGPEVIAALLKAAQDAGQASFLTVLKRFGTARSPGLLSFPSAGYTLTLDFPARGEDTLNLLERLDAITVEAGGAVNPYKDARMNAEVFAAGFPQWRRLEAWRDPAFMSDFWRRTAMVLDARERMQEVAE